jgi:hypothetical protein
MLEIFKDYYTKAKLNQERLHQGYNWTEEQIDDDLIWNVPIYDVVNRRYAAFSSLPEALFKKQKDPKGNGNHFVAASISKADFSYLCYLFRLCGSGINYKPKTGETPWNTHGFGNFFIVDLIRKGYYRSYQWIDMVPEKGFCDVKGYLLPMIKQGLRWFIVNESFELFSFISDKVNSSDRLLGIKEVVDLGNSWLINKGYKRQNFVLTAYAMDLAEYFPNKVSRDSDVYVGSNARKCLKLILPNMKHDDALRHLCEITGGYSKPYDMEDVACDFIRYIENFQSPDHVVANDGITYKNNMRCL